MNEEQKNAYIARLNSEIRQHQLTLDGANETLEVYKKAYATIEDQEKHLAAAAYALDNVVYSFDCLKTSRERIVESLHNNTVPGHDLLEERINEILPPGEMASNQITKVNNYYDTLVESGSKLDGFKAKIADKVVDLVELISETEQEITVLKNKIIDVRNY